MFTLVNLSLLFIAIGSIGGIMLVIGQAKDSAKDKADIITSAQEENAHLRTDLADIKKERSTLRDELKESGNKISEQNEKIVSLSNQLVEKSQYISDHLTGGGYAHLDALQLQGSNGKEHQITFLLVSDSELPLYNLYVEIYDYQYIVTNSTITNPQNGKRLISYDALKLSKLEYFEGNHLMAHGALSGVRVYDANEMLLAVRISARNGVHFQKIAYVIYNNQLYGGYQLFDEKGVIVKTDFFEPNLPQDAKNKITTKLKLIDERFIFQTNNF